MSTKLRPADLKGIGEYLKHARRRKHSDDPNYPVLSAWTEEFGKVPYTLIHCFLPPESMQDEPNRAEHYNVALGVLKMSTSLPFGVREYGPQQGDPGFESNDWTILFSDDRGRAPGWVPVYEPPTAMLAEAFFGFEFDLYEEGPDFLWGNNGEPPTYPRQLPRAFKHWYDGCDCLEPEWVAVPFRYAGEEYLLCIGVFFSGSGIEPNECPVCKAKGDTTLDCCVHSECEPARFNAAVEAAFFVLSNPEPRYAGDEGVLWVS